jgi:hypothetical protein
MLLEAVRIATKKTPGRDNYPRLGSFEYYSYFNDPPVLGLPRVFKLLQTAFRTVFTSVFTIPRSPRF